MFDLVSVNFASLRNWFFSRRGKLTVFYLALFVVIFPVAFSWVFANDIWKALYSGRYIAINLEFPHHSVFTFSPVKPGFLARNSFTWLGNLFFYGFHSLLGIYGLQLFRLGLVCFSLVLIHSLVDFRVNSFVFLLMITIPLGIYQKLYLRNAIFLVPFLAILWWIWHQFKVRKRWLFLLGFPLLFAFWGNFHGSYLVGLGILGLIFIGHTIDLVRAGDANLVKWMVTAAALLLVICLIVIFLKPAADYQVLEKFGKLPQNIVGIGYSSQVKPEAEKPQLEMSYYQRFKQILQSAVVKNVYDNPVRTNEYQFPLENYNQIYVSVSLFLGLLTAVVLVIDWRHLQFGFLLPFIAALILGLGYLRTVAIIPLVSVPILFSKYRLGNLDNIEISDWLRWLGIGAIVLLSLNIYYHVHRGSISSFLGSNMHKVAWGKHPRFSDKVQELCLKEYKDEKFYNGYNMGAYLIWKWWPEKKVFIDSKSSGYADEFRLEYVNNDPHELANKYNLNHALVSLTTPHNFYYLIPSPEWKVVAVDEGMILYTKDDNLSEKPISELLLLEGDELRNLAPGDRLTLLLILEFIDKFRSNEEMMGKIDSFTKWRQFHAANVFN